MANSTYSPLAWANGVAPALNATALNGHDNALAGLAAARATHIVYQAGGNTIARRADGSVVSSLATSATNNPTVIQAAINDGGHTPVSNTHVAGSLVHIARGRYDMASGLTAKYGVALRGDYGGWYDNWSSAGTFGTMLAATAALAGPLLTVGVSGAGSRVAANPHGLWVGNLLLDGSAATSQDLIYTIDTAFIVIRGCFLRGGNAGIRVAGTSGPFTGSYDMDVLDTVFKGCVDGVTVTATGTDGMIRNCRIMSCTNNSVHIESGGGGWQIHNNHLTHGGAVSHIYANGMDAIQIVGNYIDSGTVAGLYIKSGGASSIVGNYCIADAAFTDATGAYISLPWGKTTCIGNHFVTKPGSTGIKGFISTGDATKGVIANNITRQRTTSTGWVAPVVNASGVAVADRSDSGSYIGGNVTWVDA